MPFPVVDRVIYRNNPLDKVICQIRFPAVLRIDTELPSVFQEAVRADFPGYAENTSSTDRGMEAVIDQFPLPKELVPRVQWSTKNYRFTSTDEKRELSLCRSSMALVFTDYVRWEEFAHTLERPTTVLFAHYKPSFITRIGLRYIDVFKKSVLGFDKDYPWNRLLKAHVIGPLASVDVCDNIEAMDCTYEIKLKDSLGTARVKLLTVLDAETQEKCLMLDSDFYIHGNFPEAGIRSELDILHSKAHRLMRWCITDELHKALVPEVAP